MDKGWQNMVSLYSLFFLSNGWSDNVSQGEGGIEEEGEEEEDEGVDDDLGWRMSENEGEAYCLVFWLQSAMEVQLQMRVIIGGKCYCCWQAYVSAYASRKEKVSCHVMLCIPSFSDRAWFACWFRRTVCQSVNSWSLWQHLHARFYICFAFLEVRDFCISFLARHTRHGAMFAVHAQHHLPPLAPQP